MGTRRLIQRLRGAPDTAPVFVVAAPCAGAAQLARLLAQAEGTTPRRPADRLRAEQLLGATSRSSDRLTAADATPERVAELRAALAPGARRRVIDHAGVHALRVPFLAAAFPEARFVFLTRDPHEQVARMLAAWRSGRMVTYPTLPGWDGPWSLPLIPGWEGLRGQPLAEVVAAQWATITRLLLDDLAALPAGRWAAVSAERLRDDLRGTLPTLARASGLRWARPPQLGLAGRRAAMADDLALARVLLAAEAELLARLQALVAIQPVSRSVAAQLLPARLRRTLAGGTLAASLLGASLVPAPAEAATFTVTNLNDAGDGSLRDAIEDANAAAGADVITFAPGLAGTITLASELVISDSVDIQGPGAATVTVSGNDAVRVFYIYDSNTGDAFTPAVTISDLTIADGLAEFVAPAQEQRAARERAREERAAREHARGERAEREQARAERAVRQQARREAREQARGERTPRSAGVANTSPHGAGIYSYGVDLTLDGVTISGNEASSYGGGLWFSGPTMELIVRDSTISGNSAADGGGIYVRNDGVLAAGTVVTIENTTIANNTAGNEGGGISVWDSSVTVAIRGSTITGNEAEFGGGVQVTAADGAITIEGTTISQNSAIGTYSYYGSSGGTGGGVFVGAANGALTITGGTISQNSAIGMPSYYGPPGGTGGGIFVGTAGGALTITGATITENSASYDGGGVYVDAADGALTITGATITGNDAGDDGGGIYVGSSDGAVTIQSSSIADNVAAGGGGGIWLYESGGALTIEGSTITGNTATGGSGGGIYLYDTDNTAERVIRTTTIADNTAARGGGVAVTATEEELRIERSTIAGNQATAGDGGGLFTDAFGPVVVENTTISGNTASSDGGGVFASPADRLEIRHSTIAGNTAATGGGVANVALYDTPSTLDHTIVADNTATTNADLGGSFDATWSLIETPGTATITGSDNITGQDPQLGPLQDNGGPTQTHAPSFTSPAVDAGDPAFTPPPATDQRGQERVGRGRVDIGAVELNAGTLALATDSLAVSEAAGTASITVTRTGGSSGAVAVDYSVTAGTATAGQDYTPVSGTLSWADGDTAPKTITIPIVNDTRREPAETFTVTIGNATGGATLGAPTTATITIEDNDFNVFLPIVWR